MKQTIKHWVKQSIKQRVAARFSKAAATYDRAALLQREVGHRLYKRLDDYPNEPDRILEIGSSTGLLTQLLREHYPHAHLIALDIAQGMLEHARQQSSFQSIDFLCADAEALPLQSQCCDLIISNLTFQWCEHLPTLFTHCLRVLKPGGVLLFTTLGPDSLYELRDSFAHIDGYQHVNPFIDMHHVGDALLKAQFCNPVVDIEFIQLHYQSVKTLLKDLKSIGATTITHGTAQPALSGKGRLKALENAYEKFKTPEQQLPITYEIIYGYAMKSKIPQQSQSDDGTEIHIPLSRLNLTKHE